MTALSAPLRSTVGDEAGWAARPGLARTVRLSAFLVPVLLAVLAMRLAAAVVPAPASSAGRTGRLLLLMAGGWALSWLVHKALQRLLPLAALLEMSLCFPDGAPSRLRLVQRSSSAAELTALTQTPVGETAQQAAERTLALITALAKHDRHTRGHAERVRSITDLIAEAMGLSERERDRLRWAALLHDIGKLQVPASLLNSPDKPTSDEWEILRRHPEAGARLAAPLLEWLAPMDLVIQEHHERWDGSGYPTGRAGAELSLGARIVQVADSFEVMTAARSYKRPVRKEAALRELVRCAGTQFDPQVVRAMVALPQRRLLWAMGPTAWIAGLPLLGQNTATLIGSTAAQVGTLSAAAAIGAASFSPAAAAAATPVTPHPAHVVSQPARSTPLQPHRQTLTKTPTHNVPARTSLPAPPAPASNPVARPQQHVTPPVASGGAHLPAASARPVPAASSKPAPAKAAPSKPAPTKPAPSKPDRATTAVPLPAASPPTGHDGKDGKDGRHDGHGHRKEH